VIGLIYVLVEISGWLVACGFSKACPVRRLLHVVCSAGKGRTPFEQAAPSPQGGDGATGHNSRPGPGSRAPAGIHLRPPERFISGYSEVDLDAPICWRRASIFLAPSMGTSTVLYCRAQRRPDEPVGTAVFVLLVVLMVTPLARAGSVFCFFFRPFVFFLAKLFRIKPARNETNRIISHGVVCL